jgi:hypothetical protein
MRAMPCVTSCTRRVGAGEGLLLSRGDEELRVNIGRFCCDALAFESALDQAILRDLIIVLARGAIAPPRCAS